MLTPVAERPIRVSLAAAGLLAASACVGVAGVIAPKAALGLVVFAAGVAALVAHRQSRVELVLPAALLAVSALVNAPRAVSVGPVSGSGLLTLGFAGIILLYFLANPPAGSGIPRLFIAYVAWTFAAFLWGGVTSSGVQNDLVMFVTLGVAAISARSTAASGVPRYLDRLLFTAAWVSLALYGGAVAVSGFGHVRNGAAAGATGLVDPRPFALYSLCILAWASSPTRLRGRYLALTLATLALDLASLSRSAFAAGLVVVALSRLRPGSVQSRVRASVCLVVVALLFIGAALYVKPFHDRFVSGDVQNVGGVSLRLSSRDQLWRVTWDSAMQSPLIGNGPGAADAVVTDAFGNITQPHNDYLRIFDNWGLVGVLLWAGWFLPLLVRTYRAIETTQVEEERRLHRAAFLVMAGVAIGMIFDNPTVELQVMGPLGVFIGCSIGLRKRSADRSASSPTPVPESVTNLGSVGSIRPL
jgi:O-antigen ligase